MQPLESSVDIFTDIGTLPMPITATVKENTARLVLGVQRFESPFFDNPTP